MTNCCYKYEFIRDVLVLPGESEVPDCSVQFSRCALVLKLASFWSVSIGMNQLQISGRNPREFLERDRLEPIKATDKSQPLDPRTAACPHG